MDSPPDSPATVEFSEPERGVPNAAWTWFTDERTIVDTDVASGPRILVGGVTAARGAEGGDIVVLWYDVEDGTTGHAVLHPELEQDDHNGPALFVRPDGRYLAMYAGHNTDSFTRWRVSTDPHDPTDWRPERRLDTGAGTTYCNVYRLADAGDTGRTYCFTRATNWDPVALVSTDEGTTWSDAGQLLTMGGESARPYLKYWADGGRIHLIATEEHPRRRNNSIYHGSIRGETLYDSGGDVVSAELFDGTADVPAVTDLTTVFAADTVVDGTPMTDAWTIDLAADGAGNPVALFQTRADGDASDHRFYYARHDGTDWHVGQLAKAGGYLYEAESDYTGLATIDPDDPNRVVVSTTADPRTDRSLDHYQLFAGETTDDGDTWEWRPLTPDATRDNLRPLIPAWDDRTALVWMRGGYTEYTAWDTQAVGRLDPWGE